MPPFAIPSLEQNRKDDPGIWPECGAVSIKAWFRRPAESPPKIGVTGRTGVQKVVVSRLTSDPAEAYIRPIGALSAYGAIARL